ncbi:hypothetical protein [Campylobacter ureolyticus]|uniref:hypothetical protein n=1 Tax=Campylobacter ureolyticus TaxID=827 RepID=UPI0022B50336|nr:hypothetical protein [Campylobacter ureolyticus]MCZ6111643.1 hypothetical protein [Campylobacter ureolyticus]
MWLDFYKIQIITLQAEKNVIDKIYKEVLKLSKEIHNETAEFLSLDGFKKI